MPMLELEVLQVLLLIGTAYTLPVQNADLFQDPDSVPTAAENALRWPHEGGASNQSHPYVHWEKTWRPSEKFTSTPLSDKNSVSGNSSGNRSSSNIGFGKSSSSNSRIGGKSDSRSSSSTVINNNEIHYTISISTSISTTPTNSSTATTNNSFTTNNDIITTNNITNKKKTPHRRARRQLTYFVLTWMGKEEIRAFVRNTKAETISSLMNTVGPQEILYIISCLEGDEITRLLTSLPPESIIRLARTMSAEQLNILLSYVPAQGLVQLTEAFSSGQLQDLLVLLPPTSIVNMTRTLPAGHTVKLIRSMPPEAMLKMIQSLPEDALMQLMTSLPPEAMVPVLTSLPADTIRELVSSLPPGFLDSFIAGLSGKDLGDIVRNITDQQMLKLITSFPIDHAPNVTSLLTPEMLGALLDSLPKDLIGNLTLLLPSRTLTSMLSAVSRDTLLLVMSRITSIQIMDVMRSIPRAAWPVLLEALPLDFLLSIAASLPVDKIVNVTVALAEHPEVVSRIFDAVDSPQLFTNLTLIGAFPRETLWEILDKLPNPTIGKLAAVLPVKVFRFAKAFQTELSGLNITVLLDDVPKDLFVKLVTSVPPDVITNLSLQLSSNQLKKIMRFLTPDLLKLVVTSTPPKVIVNMAASLPVSVMTRVLQVLSPQLFRSLVRAVPLTTARSIVEEILSEDRMGSASSSEQPVLSGPMKLATVLNSVPPETVTRLVKAIPRDVLIDVINALPADVIARGARLLAGEGGGALMEALPVEAVAYSVSIIPPETIAKVVDAVPKSTLSSFGQLATHIPVDTIKRFFQQVRVGTLKKIITQMPPELVEKLVSSIPPEAVGLMAQSFSSVTVTPFMQSLRSEDLRRLIRSVSTTTLTNLVTSIPQDVIVNLTKALPAPQLRKLMSAVPPVVIGHLVNYLDPDAVMTLITAMPPELVDNLLSTMPRDLLVNMTRLLPPTHLKQVTDMLPTHTIGQLVSLLPPDVLASLVSSLQAEALLGMIQKLDPAQLMEILAKLPHKVILNMTLSQTPEQTMTLLRTIPPEGVVNLTYVIPTDVMIEMMQAVPPEALFGIASSMPLKDVLNLATRLTPEQMTRVMERLASDPDLLPNLLTSFDLNRFASVAEAVPFDLLMQISSRLNVATVKDVLQRLLPQARRFLATMLDKGLDTLTSNWSQTLQACLQDVSLVVHSMLNFSDWAFHFLDASGKPGRGMLEGNIHMFGNYDQCKRIHHVIGKGSRESDVITGSYCHVQFDIPLKHLPPIPGDGMLPMPEIALDLCVPNTCRDFDIHGLLKTVELPLNMSIPRVSCQWVPDLMQDTAALGVVVAVGFLVVIVILATVVDCVSRRRFPTIHLEDDVNDNKYFNDDASQGVPKTMQRCEGPNHGIGCQGRTSGTRNGANRWQKVADEDVLSSKQLLAQWTGIPSKGSELTVSEMQQLMVSGQGHLTCCNPALHCTCISLHDHQQADGARVCASAASSLPFSSLPFHSVASHGPTTTSPITRDCRDDVKADDVLGQAMMTTVMTETERENGQEGKQKEEGKQKGEGKQKEGEGMQKEEGKQKEGNGKKKEGEGKQKEGEGKQKEGEGKQEEGEGKQKEEGSKMEGRGSGEQSGSKHLPPWLRVVRTFSLVTSLRALLTLPPRAKRRRHDGEPAGFSSSSDNGDAVTRVGLGSLDCLHGIRVLTMLWIILSNTVLFSALFFENLMNAANELISLPAQIILNSSLGQDTFFLISGVVTTLTFLTSVNISGGLRPRHVLHHYLHRLTRLLPAYALVLGLCACLLQHLADGPHWPPSLQVQCRQQWWMNLLFLNNYFVSLENMCMSWSWFVTNLMQFHWIAPLVLVPFALGRHVVGVVAATVLVTIHIVSTALLEVDINGDFLRQQSQYLWQIYQQPYCRIAPYAMGLLLGFLLTTINGRCYINKLACCLLWVMCACLSCVLMLVTYDENRHLLQDASGWPHAARVVHETLQRPLWALVVSWVIFACTTGNGGWVKSMLAWRGWIPMSRLTYCVYLVHPVLIVTDLLALRVFAYFTLHYVIVRYISYVVISYGLALVLNLLAESPFLALERVLLFREFASTSTASHSGASSNATTSSSRKRAATAERTAECLPQNT